MERVNDRPAPHGAHGTAAGQAGTGTAEHALYVGPHHPRAGTYVTIFVVLFLVTAAEVAVGLYVEGPARLPGLFTLMIVKGALIAAFYMHLRFDSRIFSVFFIAGLILFAGMIFSFLMLFTAHPRIAFVPTLAEKTASETPAAGAAGSTGATGASSTAGAITTPTVAR